MACKGDLLAFRESQEKLRREESKTSNPRLVTVGFTGKNALFTQRGALPDEGFVRINGKTISGWVQNYTVGGKVFMPYAHLKNAKEAA